ncbi:hypothetical protein N658DRAFT_68992 [Parathielavia hyrcaniae]|uniref:Uncharacterized protein n=1 Tax=Parathielavia hyrcaniae TaxID=113614 RepID=A0AAN6T1E5_9PEZI|nr:hypothetical protein N658DRAFT_68992 [Parathielavia hyrcaniae]
MQLQRYTGVQYHHWQESRSHRDRSSSGRQQVSHPRGGVGVGGWGGIRSCHVLLALTIAHLNSSDDERFWQSRKPPLVVPVSGRQTSAPTKKTAHRHGLDFSRMRRCGRGVNRTIPPPTRNRPQPRAPTGRFGALLRRRKEKSAALSVRDACLANRTKCSLYPILGTTPRSQATVSLESVWRPEPLVR